MPSLRERIREFKKRRRANGAIKELKQRVARGRHTDRPHSLPKPLIVSLTSYPARFGTLAKSLQSILFQSVQPDTTILWVSYEDFEEIPQEVLDLRQFGLEIAKCDDTRSFKKIVPTLQNHPGCFVVTVDDDLWYPADCLEQLTAAYDASDVSVITRRAHKVRMGTDGNPSSYSHWEFGLKSAEKSALVFPTGGAGALYPPGAFHEDVCNSKIFMDICATADDVWLYWMWRMNGYLGQKTLGRPRIIEWPGTQVSSLRAENIHGDGNDRCIAGMLNRYGFPA